MFSVTVNRLDGVMEVIIYHMNNKNSVRIPADERPLIQPIQTDLYKNPNEAIALPGTD
jgi:hypothetical protein